MIVIPFLVLLGILAYLVVDDQRTDMVEREESRIRIDRDLARAVETIRIPFLDAREPFLFDFSDHSRLRLCFNDDILEWCAHNLTQDVHVVKDVERQCTHLVFASEYDAFLFKMAWR